MQRPQQGEVPNQSAGGSGQPQPQPQAQMQMQMQMQMQPQMQMHMPMQMQQPYPPGAYIYDSYPDYPYDPAAAPYPSAHMAGYGGWGMPQQPQHPPPLRGVAAVPPSPPPPAGHGAGGAAPGLSLPPGWFAYTDCASGRTYYSHPDSGQICWEPPPPPPAHVAGRIFSPPHPPAGRS